MNDITSSTAPRFTSSRLILWATIAGSIALSIVSAYETWLGLNDFMPTGIIGSLMAVILTFGVQIILFAISWSIAEHTRDGFRSNMWRIAIWIMCAFFSGYFSFYGFFQGTGGRAESVRSAYIEAQQDEVLASIEASLVSTLSDRHQSDLVSSSDYENWIEELRSLIDAANNAKAQIEANNRVKSTELRDRQRQLRDERDSLAQSRNSIEADVRQSERQLADLRKESENLNARADELDRAVTTLEGERDSLQIQYDQEIETGDGPRARKLLLDLNSKQAELLAAQKLQESNTEKMANIEPLLLAAEIAAEDGVTERRRSEIDARVQIIEDEINGIETRLSGLTEGSDFDLQGQSTTLTVLRSDLEGQDYSAHDKMVNQCSTLKQQLIESNVGQSIMSVSCSNSTVLATVNGLVETQKATETFRTDCVENRPEVIKVEGIDLFTYDPVIAHLQECALSEPNADARSELRKATALMKTGRGDEAQAIKQASVALFQDMQANAILSLVFAAIVDLLVLLCALVGKNIGLPENVRAIDKLISMMRKPTDDRPDVEALAPLPDDQRQMDMIDPIINRLIRDGYAEFDISDYDGTSQLIFRKGARLYLARLRGMEISEQAVTGTIKREEDNTRKRSARRRPQEPI